MLTNEPAGHQWYNGVDMNWQIGARDVGEMLDTIAYRYIGIGLAGWCMSGTMTQSHTSGHTRRGVVRGRQGGE